MCGASCCTAGELSADGSEFATNDCDNASKLKVKAGCWEYVTAWGKGSKMGLAGNSSKCSKNDCENGSKLKIIAGCSECEKEGCKKGSKLGITENSSEYATGDSQYEAGDCETDAKPQNTSDRKRAEASATDNTKEVLGSDSERSATCTAPFLGHFLQKRVLVRWPQPAS